MPDKKPDHTGLSKKSVKEFAARTTKPDKKRMTNHFAGNSLNGKIARNCLK